MRIPTLLTLTAALFVLSGCDLQDRPVDVGETALASLGGFADGSHDEDGPRRVWAKAEEYASPSPDGSLITFVDWATGDVAVHDVATGENRRLTDKGEWTENGSWAEEPLFAPDGRSVAYSYGNIIAQGSFQYELRVVAVGDTTPRVLYALTPDDEWLVATDWSPIHGILVETNRGPAHDHVTELLLVDPETGSHRVVGRYPKGTEHAHEASFSPDGRFIVYRHGEDVRVIAPDGTGDHSLGVTARWVLGWSPTGRDVLIHASVEGHTGIWAVPVANGMPNGDRRLVRDGMTAFLPGGLANDGYYYLVPVDAQKVHIVPVDLASGRELAPPTAITTAVDGTARGAAWSPDGRFLAYAVLDPTERRTRLMVRDADGEAVREVATLAGPDVRQLLWSTDDNALIVFAGSPNGTQLLRVAVQSGEVTPTAMPGIEGVTTAPGGRLVVARSATRGGTAAGLFLFDPRTGTERQVADVASRIQAMGVSPDGSRLGIILPDEGGVTRLVTMPLEGGAMREVARAELPAHLEGTGMGSVNWTADGRELVVMRGSWDGSEDHELVAVPATGGTLRRVRGSAGERGHVLNPAGNRVAFVGGEPRTELWVAEDPVFARP